MFLRRAWAVIFLAAAVASVSAQDWSQWRGPSRNGVAAAFSAPAQWPDKPTRVWELTVGAGHSSPIVSSGRVFQLSRVGQQEAVTAIDLISGKQAWQHLYDAPYDVNPAARTHGSGPKSTPIASGGRLFTLGISGILSAFDAASGKLQWRKHYAKEFDATAPDFGVAMSPAVDNGLLIVHVGGNRNGALTALDTASGKEKWAWKGEGPAYASPVIGTFAGTRQVITQSRSHLVALSASDGTLLWRIPFTTEYDQNIVTPVILDDLVIYSGINKPLTAVRVSQPAGKWSAQPVWENADLPMYMSSPVAASGHLFGLTHRNRGQFFCVDVKTGKIAWTTRGREGENAALVIAGDVLLATTTEGELVVARRDPVKFEVIRRYTLAASAIWAHPVPAGRGVVIKDSETVSYWTF